MAQKRMFDRAIIDTDRFMDLPMSGKAIYFLLGMEADDEGFVSYKKVLRIHGGNEDDVKVLTAKGFLILFPSGVVVITDWNKNNWLDTRRTRPTEYKKEKTLLQVTEDKMYVLSECVASATPEEYSIEEYRREEKSIVHTTGDFSLFWKEYPKKIGKGAAEKAWQKMKPPIEDVLNAIRVQRQTDQWLKNKGQFIPNPATWLNQKRWEDEVEVTINPKFAKYDK